MNHKFFWLIVAVLVVVVRLLPHAPNLAPMGALAIVGGLYLDKKYALVFPLLVSMMADIFLGFVPILTWVYLGYLVTIGVSLWAKKTQISLLPKILSLSLLSSVSFFLITNFGVWLTTSMYQKTLTGLIQCYLMAVPFFRNTLVSDVGFTLLLVATYLWSQKLYKNNKIKPAVTPSTPTSFLAVNSSLKK